MMILYATNRSTKLLGYIMQKKGKSPFLFVAFNIQFFSRLEHPLVK